MCKPTLKHLFTLLQLLLAGGLLWWVASQPQFGADLQRSLGQADVWWSVTAVAAAGLSVFLHILRWHACLRIVGVPAKIAATTRAFLASSFIGSFVLGGFGGDVARVALLGLEHEKKGAAIAVSVMADRLCGLVSLVLPVVFFSIPLRAELSQTPLGIGTWRFLWGYLVCSLLLLIFTWNLSTQRARTLLPAWFPGKQWITQASLSLQMLRSRWWPLGGAVVVSAAMLLLYFVSFWAFARGLGTSITARQMFALLPIIEAATTVPITPGGVGLREQLFTDQLAAMAGVPAATAVAISMAGFLATQLWYMLGGLLLLPRKKSQPVK